MEIFDLPLFIHYVIVVYKNRFGGNWMQDKRSESFNVLQAKFVPVAGPENQSKPNQQIKTASSGIKAKFHRSN